MYSLTNGAELNRPIPPLILVTVLRALNVRELPWVHTASIN